MLAMTTSPSTAPVFGRRTETVKRVPFTLLSYVGDTEVEHSLTARAAIDASTALLANSPDERVAAEAINNLLYRALIDDDGIARSARPYRASDEPDDDEDDGEDDDTAPDTDDEGDEPAADVWLLEGTDEEFDTLDEAHAYARDHGSSLRRFVALMNDREHWVELRALRALVRFLSKEAGNRPTKPSGGSSPRRTGKRRR